MEAHGATQHEGTWHVSQRTEHDLPADWARGTLAAPTLFSPFSFFSRLAVINNFVKTGGRGAAKLFSSLYCIHILVDDALV